LTGDKERDVTEADKPWPGGIDIIDLARLSLDGLRRLTGDDFEELTRPPSRQQ
jgi:hypothetical protein